MSAALGDRPSLSIDLMDAILRVCGVRGTDRQVWQEAWRRLAGPRQQAALERQRAGYDLASMVESGGHGDSPSSVPTAGGRPRNKPNQVGPSRGVADKLSRAGGRPNEPMEGSA